MNPSAAQTQWVPLPEGKRKKLKKLKKLTARDNLDTLIDWYEKNRPDHPKEIPGGVSIKPTTLDRWAAKVGNKKWIYRGWTLTLAELPTVKKLKIKK